MFFQNRFQNWDVPGNKNISCVFYSTDADGKYPLHCHSFYEMNYLQKGEMYNTLNGKRYLCSDNTLFIIPPMAFHGNRNVTPVDSVVIQFSQGFLTGASARIGQSLLVPADPKEPYIIPDKNGDIFRVLDEIADYTRGRKAVTVPDEFTESSLILSLLSACIREKYLTLVQDSGAVTRMPALDDVINYILANPEQKTDMKQAARIANMSYYNFSRQFKETIGMNFSDYCNVLRIHLAEELLVTTDLPISDISARIGIDTQSYFSKLFKQVNGVSPTAFRSQNSSG